MNPEMIILDEPFNGLSAAYQTLLVQLLQQLNQAGKSILLASHNYEQVQQIAKRIVIFNEGHQITNDLPLTEIQRQPALMAALRQL